VLGICNKRSYLKSGRLQDVLSLLQVLAIDSAAHRSEGGLMTELQRAPISGTTWVEVAREHPEFFRVRPSGGNVVSLLVRHVTSPGTDGRPPLTQVELKELLGFALAIHDRELDQARAWHIWLPLGGVVLGAIIPIIVAALL